MRGVVFPFPYLINFSSFIKVKPLAHSGSDGKAQSPNALNINQGRGLIQTRSEKSTRGGRKEKKAIQFVMQQKKREEKIETSFLCVFSLLVNLCLGLCLANYPSSHAWQARGCVPFHLVWLLGSLLVRPMPPFSLSCPLLQLANQANHCTALLLPPPP